ncbi:T3SS (YopN, CesT) and YbjN peptide-binding chaperone 1 [Mycolicibacterium monacense]|uniref:T3SS (YopN, CesT) and YbjN peptide-binding chaperone 1 n=1 Tax=Mycolicibacterium monacense TaxID=85693 RepID=UPI0007EA46BB|nr:YbjN domain-containing protein [Mycolicibacterium monacense]OBF56915.1 hypothetical protein A5778_05495 [Mycolicibacterium monacense]
MPRYRFSWGNLSPTLLTALTSALHLEGEPTEALRHRYGARPKTDFVKDTWPVLLAVWLPDDSASRHRIAENLFAAGLGETSISVDSDEGQLAYLSSCRNTVRLREIVLAAFRAAGEPPQLQPPSTPGDEAQTQRSAGGEAGEFANLDEWIEAVLKDQFGLEEIRRDPDGDIPLPRGSSVLFIRPHQADFPFLEIFAPLLHGVDLSPDIYEAVNALNLRVPIAKALVIADSRSVVLSASLLADTLSARELTYSLRLVSDAADHFDTLLQRRFNGETMMKEQPEVIDV